MNWPTPTRPKAAIPKRWQDVKELLDAGIDVWTALNIQHLESLADVVAQITGVTVRETVPDSILQTAQDVVLVDITPDELIARLKAGKVYLAANGAAGDREFLPPGNLTALRELALRRTADRVEDQMTQILRQKAIEGPWGTTERLLVCIGPDGGGERLARQAARLATSLNAGWIAVCLTRPGLPSELTRDHRISATLDLAASLGAEVLRLTSDDFTQDILRIARRENVTQIVVGRRQKASLLRRFARSLPDALLREAGEISVLVIPLDDTPKTGARFGAAAKSWVTQPRYSGRSWQRCFVHRSGYRSRGRVERGDGTAQSVHDLSGGCLACSSWRGTGRL